MNKKIIFILVVITILVAGVYFLFKNSKTYTPDSYLTPQETYQNLPTHEPPIITSDANLVTYMDEGYSPNTLRVKKGTTVTFKNNSSQLMWTASDIHPTHKSYPTTGGCLGSTFDACEGTQQNNSSSFKFDIIGTWKYHNHLNPLYAGTIIVE